MPFRQMSGGRHEVVLGPVRRGAFPAVPETPREGSTAADRSATPGHERVQPAKPRVLRRPEQRRRGR